MNVKVMSVQVEPDDIDEIIVPDPGFHYYIFRSIGGQLDVKIHEQLINKAAVAVIGKLASKEGVIELKKR